MIRACRARCGRPAEPRRRYCSDACVPTSTWRKSRRLQGPPEVKCRQCHGPMAVDRLTQHHCSINCSIRASHKRRWDAGSRHKRRWDAGSRRKHPRIRYRQRADILERDAWRCGICGAVIDPELRWPHPGSPSIDHIDPDGPHEPANWQASHLGCNVAKGARAA